jgi:hypothetical protein
VPCSSLAKSFGRALRSLSLCAGIDVWDTLTAEPLVRRRDEKIKKFVRGVVAASWVGAEMIAFACADGK